MNVILFVLVILVKYVFVDVIFFFKIKRENCLIKYDNI